MNAPSAYEIAEAWEDMDDAVKAFRRAPHSTLARMNAEDRLLEVFTMLANRLAEVPRVPPESP